MMSSASRYDLFLSHNRRQKPWVRELVKFLRANGLAVFFDEDDIRPGEDIVAALESAVEGSRVLVLVLSQSSVHSKWVSFETAMKLYEDPDARLRRLIPIILEPVDRSLIRPGVRRLDAVDLTDPTTRQREFAHFLESIGIPVGAAVCIEAWPEPGGIEAVSIADIDTVLKRGWNGERLLEELINLDYRILEGLTAEHEGQKDQWAPVFMDHPETWRLLMNANREVVGYWHFVPLFEEDHTRALSGQLLDSEITTDKVRLFELPGRYDLYFVSVGVLPEYRRTRAIRPLFNSLFDVLLQLAKDGVHIDNVCANAYTRSGEAHCKSFGLKYLRPHTSHGKVYSASFASVLEHVPEGYEELRRLYHESKLDGAAARGPS